MTTHDELDQVADDIATEMASWPDDHPLGRFDPMPSVTAPPPSVLPPVQPLPTDHEPHAQTGPHVGPRPGYRRVFVDVPHTKVAEILKAAETPATAGHISGDAIDRHIVAHIDRKLEEPVEADPTPWLNRLDELETNPTNQETNR